MFLTNHSSACLLHYVRVVKNVACLSSLLFSTHSPIFKPLHRVWPLLYHSVYTVLCLKTQSLEARRRAKLGESKIATKLCDKILSNTSIVLKRDGHTYLRLFHGFNL